VIKERVPNAGNEGLGDGTSDRHQLFMACSFMMWKSLNLYKGADKFLARPGGKQATATEDFDVHVSCLLS
jgi:hypothetical protein